VSLQANVNLDALLEKMKAELERVKEAPQIDFTKINNCLNIAKKAAEERDARN